MDAAAPSRGRAHPLVVVLAAAGLALLLAAAGSVVARELGLRVAHVPVLHGGTPGDGVPMLQLSGRSGIEPPVPATVVDGGAGTTLLLATCADCTGGDVYGSVLQRLSPAVLEHDGIAVHVLLWGGDPAAWAREWQLDPRVRLHAVSPAAAATLATDMMFEPTIGHMRLIDGTGTWRASYPSAGTVPSEVSADLLAVAGDR